MTFLTQMEDAVQNALFFSGKRLLRNSKWDLLIPRLQRVLPARDIFLMKLDTDLYLSVQWTICWCLERVISLGCNKGKWSGEIGLSSRDEWMVCCCCYDFLGGDLGGCRVLSPFYLGFISWLQVVHQMTIISVHASYGDCTIGVISDHHHLNYLGVISDLKEILLGSQGDRDLYKTIECERSRCFRNLKIRKLRWKSYRLMQRSHLFNRIRIVRTFLKQTSALMYDLQWSVEPES